MRALSEGTVLRRTILVAVLALAAAASGCATSRAAEPKAPSPTVRPFMRGVEQPEFRRAVAAGVQVAF
jgi:hypothetical protein